MKELTIEQKAKAYDEAIEKARLVLQEKGNEPDGASILSKLFPELIESEDEIMLKVAIQFTKENQYKYTSYKGHRYSKEAILAWLEKHGEYTEINPSEFDSQLNRLLGQFKSLPKEELASSLSFYLNVVQNDGTYEEEKQSEQKPAGWTQKDGKNLAELWEILSVHRNTNPQVDNLMEWVKDLVSYKRQEWSEEDEQYLEDTLNLLEGHRSKNTYGDVVEWLKELKDRVGCEANCTATWKPSEEQMVAIQEAINIVGILTITGSKINSLYQDLKKLKG